MWMQIRGGAEPEYGIRKDTNNVFFTYTQRRRIGGKGDDNSKGPQPTRAHTQTPIITACSSSCFCIYIYFTTAYFMCCLFYMHI